MPARRAAASALSLTDGSMPSLLHDTREFMLSSGSESGALSAPSASPHVPDERQSKFARVVCLWLRLFRVTVNNPLRNRAAHAESCLWDEFDREGVSGEPVMMPLAPPPALRTDWGPRPGTCDCCAAKIPLKRVRHAPRGTPCRSTKLRWKTSISCSTTCFRSTATTIFRAL